MTKIANIFILKLLIFYSFVACGGSETPVKIPAKSEEKKEVANKQSNESHSAGENLDENFEPVSIDPEVIQIGESHLGDYITPALVRINKGSYTMGDLIGNGEVDEQPTRKVTINYDFYIGKYEVTFKEYDKFCEDTNTVKPDDDALGRGNRPVINVTWLEAKAYTEWLSKKTGEKYRLPTEAEWEYVARAEQTTSYHFGDSVGLLKHYAWYLSNAKSETHEVGKKYPNQWGIHDMLGNVWEWCEDWYKNNYEDLPSNGSAYTINTSEKVLRGGSFNDENKHLKSSNRSGFNPTIKMNDTGFRLVKEVGAYESMDDFE
jgi:formylglycine-generating enzyme required for sulfatase activity